MALRTTGIWQYGNVARRSVLDRRRRHFRRSVPSVVDRTYREHGKYVLDRDRQQPDIAAVICGYPRLGPDYLKTIKLTPDVHTIDVRRFTGLPRFEIRIEFVIFSLFFLFFYESHRRFTSKDVKITKSRGGWEEGQSNLPLWILRRSVGRYIWYVKVHLFGHVLSVKCLEDNTVG